MAIKRTGSQTIAFENPPWVIAEASVVGKKEGEGPLAQGFDEIIPDDLYGEDSWEKAESKLQNTAIQKAITKAGIPANSINYIFAGDLLNQCGGSHYAIRGLDIPFFGLYGACSTMAESIMLSSMTIDGGFADYVVAATSSHFCSAEKQFRFPLEYGGQRPMSAQWTVTGAGSLVLGAQGSGVCITHATTGKIVDLGVKDGNNMGAAMAPAAADTIAAHFSDTGFKPSDYDFIVTGDLGSVGSSILIDLLLDQGLNIEANHQDCGCLIFDNKKQDTHAGASGCGCSAAVLSAYFLPELKEGRINKILFVATGALMSPLSLLQGESIPCIAHAVTIEKR